MCISTSCLFGRARRKVCFQPDVEHFPPQICLFFFSCRSDCVTGVPVCHAGFLCDFFFFFLIPLVLNLELSKLREWKEPHRGYPSTEDRDSVTAQSDTSTAAFQQCGGHCSCRCCSHPQAAAVLAETSPSDNPRDRRTAQRF